MVSLQEAHASHFMEALTEEKTKVPIKNEIDKMEERSSLPRKLPMLDHPCTNLPVKLCSLGKGP